MLFSMFLVERLGRKALLIISISGSALSILALGTFFYIQEKVLTGFETLYFEQELKLLTIPPLFRISSTLKHKKGHIIHTRSFYIAL